MRLRISGIQNSYPTYKNEEQSVYSQLLNREICSAQCDTSNFRYLLKFQLSYRISFNAMSIKNFEVCFSNGIMNGIMKGARYHPRFRFSATLEFLDQSKFMINIQAGWFGKNRRSASWSTALQHSSTIDINASCVRRFVQRSELLKPAGKERCRNDLADNRI